MTSRLNGRAWACLFLMALAAGAVYQAAKWPLSAKLFPMIVGISLFLLALTEFAFNLFGAQEDEEKEGPDPRVERKQALLIFAWCLGFFAMVVLLGFTVTIPLFVFLYVKPYSKEGWGISILLSALSGIFFWGLFVWALNVHFEPGLLEVGLRSLGVF